MIKHPKGKKIPRIRKEKVEELAMKAYQTYAETALKNAAYGNVMPVWDDLFADQKEAWRNVVKFIHQNVPRGTYKTKKQ